MGFLIEVNVWIGSKIGSMLSNLEKVWKFWHLCCQIRRISHNFSSQSFKNPIVSTFRSMDALFFKNFHSLTKTRSAFVIKTCFFFSFLDFVVLFSKFTQNTYSYIFKNANWIPELDVSKFKPICARKSDKIFFEELQKT